MVGLILRDFASTILILYAMNVCCMLWTIIKFWDFACFFFFGALYEYRMVTDSLNWLNLYCSQITSREAGREKRGLIIAEFSLFQIYGVYFCGGRAHYRNWSHNLFSFFVEKWSNGVCVISHRNGEKRNQIFSNIRSTRRGEMEIAQFLCHFTLIKCIASISGHLIAQRGTSLFVSFVEYLLCSWYIFNLLKSR